MHIAWHKIRAYISRLICLLRLPTPVRRTLRNFIYTIAIIHAKSRIRKLERNCKTLNDYFNLIQNISQKKYEILHLLQRVFERRVRFIAEIGTGAGGTFYLLCKVAQPDAMIITIDIKMPPWRKKLLKFYAQPGKTAIAINADSHSQDTIKHVMELLDGNKLDLLLIDGDHSYEGVKKDFFNYSPLVGKGGWIIFHDIIPDYRTRYGIRTTSWTGEVPKFWNQIKRDYSHFEIVDDPNQDGYGIGVLKKE